MLTNEELLLVYNTAVNKTASEIYFTLAQEQKRVQEIKDFLKILNIFL